MLTTQQKAQIGIGLAEEAIIQFLNTRGNSAQQEEIQENLGIGQTTATGNTGLVGTLLADLASQNIVRLEGHGNQTKVQLLATQSGNLGRGAANANR